jgi:hypothetical protein
MGCGCKNKQNSQPTVQTTQSQVNQQSIQNIQTQQQQTSVQENVQKVIEKYYNKK